MRISEFLVHRYGPLSGPSPARPKDFCLLYGHNEDGKTLTVEALVRMLLPGDVKQFSGIQRIPEEPEGYVVLCHEDGGETKLPEAGSLPDFTDLGSDHCRNIFVIRDSDLSIVAEPAFYTDVADRLTGLQTQEIEAIVEKLRELGSLTPTGRIADREDQQKIGSRLEEARAAIDTVEALSERVENQQLDRCEERIGEITARLHNIEAELQMQEQARMREKHRTGSAALEDLREALEEIEGLGRFNAEEEQTWSDAAQCRKAALDDVETLTAEADRLQEKAKDLAGQLNQRERELQSLERRADRLEGVRAAVQEYREGPGRAAPTAGQISARRFFMAIFGLLAAASLLGMVAAFHWAFAVLAGLFGVFCAVAGLSLLRQTALARAARQELERIRSWAASGGIAARRVSEIIVELRQFDHHLEQVEDQVSTTRTELEVARRRLEELRKQRIPEREKAAAEAEQTIDETRRSAEVETLQEYRARLEVKNRLQQRIDTQKAVLQNQLGSEHEELNKNIQDWQQKLEELAGYREEAPEVAYNEDKVRRLRDERRRLQEERRALRNELDALHGQLRDLERTGVDILGPDADLTCTHTTDLPAVREELRRFIQEHEQRIEHARAAIAVFEQIGREEEEKVAELFGPESRVTRLFGEITGGLYDSVDYVREEDARRVEVRMSDGRALDAGKLSGGAWDQLYLSVRLALGEALLGGEAGFFIMDDPFIKADPDRLRRQLQVLKRIADRGWQVLYFTAKGEVREALADEIDAGRVTEVPLPEMRRP